MSSSDVEYGGGEVAEPFRFHFEIAWEVANKGEGRERERRAEHSYLLESMRELSLDSVPPWVWMQLDYVSYSCTSTQIIIDVDGVERGDHVQYTDPITEPKTP